MKEKFSQASQWYNDSCRFEARSWPDVPRESYTISLLWTIQVELLHAYFLIQDTFQDVSILLER